MKRPITIGKNLLETITSALYERPIVLFREYVQNSLDALIEAKAEGKDTENSSLDSEESEEYRRCRFVKN